MLVLTCSTPTLTPMTKGTQPLVNPDIATAPSICRDIGTFITQVHIEVSAKHTRSPNGYHFGSRTRTVALSQHHKCQDY